MWMLFNMTQASDMADPSHKIQLKMTPVSVEETCKWADQCLRETIEKRENLYRHFILTYASAYIGLEKPANSYQILSHRRWKQIVTSGLRNMTKIIYEIFTDLSTPSCPSDIILWKKLFPSQRTFINMHGNTWIQIQRSDIFKYWIVGYSVGPGWMFNWGSIVLSGEERGRHGGGYAGPLCTSLHCQWGVWHYAALIVSQAGVDLSYLLSHASSPLSLSTCTVYHGAEPSRTINWIQKINKLVGISRVQVVTPRRACSPNARLPLVFISEWEQ